MHLFQRKGIFPCHNLFRCVFCPTGDLLHWNAQHLQWLNGADRSSRADWWGEAEGDRGQAQRVALSVHCRRRLKGVGGCWRSGCALFMPLWTDSTLSMGAQTDSSGLKTITGFRHCSHSSFALHPNGWIFFFPFSKDTVIQSSWAPHKLSHQPSATL